MKKISVFNDNERKKTSTLQRDVFTRDAFKKDAIRITYYILTRQNKINFLQFLH